MPTYDVVVQGKGIRLLVGDSVAVGFLRVVRVSANDALSAEWSALRLAMSAWGSSPNAIGGTPTLTVDSVAKLPWWRRLFQPKMEYVFLAEQFEDIFNQLAQGGASELKPVLREVHEAFVGTPPDAGRARDALIQLFSYLASPAGRTHANCCAADHFLLLNSALRATQLPGRFIDFVQGADCLHDSLSAPEIASNFESTPEQLLDKARAL